MRFSTFYLYQIFFHATFVASKLYPWVEGDLVGGHTTYVSFVDDEHLPLLVDFSSFEVDFFSGGNDSPMLLYISPKYNLSDNLDVAHIKDPAYSRLGQESYYSSILNVPWSIGPNIARGYFLGFRSHLKQNESIEVITYTTRVSMINNGTIPAEVEEAAKADGQLNSHGPKTSFACNGQPCSREAALSGITLTQPKVKKTKKPLTENQKFTIGISATLGGISLILLPGLIWRCRQRRSERKDSKMRWWNKIPSPEAGASELQERIGPYTTAELGGGGHHGSVFELQAGSIRRSSEGKGVLSMEASELEERQKLNPGGDDTNDDAKINAEDNTPGLGKGGSERRDVDEILPANPQFKRRDRKYNSAPTPESTKRPTRDTSPHESTAMLDTPMQDALSDPAPEVVVTRPASSPLLQSHVEYESIPRQSRRMADADLEALAGAFAPPAPRPKPPPRTGGWVYR
ncbi:hypothetical protein BKA64DRAFT_667840 [Cadophora sp. MPI-SDFR-AT-0126]|nr:hypothetical protein BKA64DRAFT_667840 [Leotiomycetes sp. MPI-SDFR-AT-0126]